MNTASTNSTIYLGHPPVTANNDTNISISETSSINRISDLSKRKFNNIFPLGTDRRYFTIIGVRALTLVALAVAAYGSLLGLGHLGNEYILPHFEREPSQGDSPITHYLIEPLVGMGIAIIVTCAVALLIMPILCCSILCKHREKWHEEQQKLIRAQSPFDESVMP